VVPRRCASFLLWGGKEAFFEMKSADCGFMNTGYFIPGGFYYENSN
jgi:hypothetical protein